MNAGKMFHRLVSIVILVAIAGMVRGQPRNYGAALPKVQATGFYEVNLSPDITAFCAPDLHDLRIRDSAGGEAPYLHGMNAIASGNGFHRFSIVGDRMNARGNTQITLQNDAENSIEVLMLLVRNTNARRTASISGSDDGRTFFSLRDSVLLQADGNRGDTAGVAIALPATGYPLLRIEIFDRGLLPLEILSAGIYVQQQARPLFINVPDPSIVRRDSANQRTYLWLSFAKPYPVDMLKFFVGTKVPFFRRAAALYVDNIPVATFTIDRAAEQIAWAKFTARQVLIVINNEDSPPLDNLVVQAAQQRQHLFAYLERDVKYTLDFGDTARRAPVYDLRHFRDSIRTHSLGELQPGPIEIISSKRLQAQMPASRPPGKWILWGIIVIVLSGLTVATIGLMRQVRKKT